MLAENQQQQENKFSKNDGDTDSKLSFKINSDLINNMANKATPTVAGVNNNTSTNKVNIKLSSSQNSLRRENSMKQIIQQEQSSSGGIGGGGGGGDVSTSTAGTPIQNDLSSLVQDVPSIKFRDVVFAKKFGSSPYDSDR